MKLVEKSTAFFFINLNQSLTRTRIELTPYSFLLTFVSLCIKILFKEIRGKIMDRIYVDTNWTFKECVKKIRTLKSQYQRVLVSFSFLQDAKKEATFIRQTRNEIYSLPYDEWKRDKLWEYMNDDIEYVVIKLLK